MKPRLDLDAAAWADRADGATTSLKNPHRPEEVQYEATIRWANGGWTELVRVCIGGNDLATAEALTGDQLLQAVRDAEWSMREWERTRQAVRILRRFRDEESVDWPDRAVLSTDPQDRVRTAAGLYRELAAIGWPKPTETVADALAVSRATAGRLISQARDQGYLGPAKRTRAGERNQP